MRATIHQQYHITDLHIPPILISETPKEPVEDGIECLKIPASREKTLFARRVIKKFEYLSSLEASPMTGEREFLISGDLFHYKSQISYTNKSQNCIMDLLDNLGNIAAICGNHDLPQSSLALYDHSLYSLTARACPNFHDVVTKGDKDIQFNAGILNNLMFDMVIKATNPKESYHQDIKKKVESRVTILLEYLNKVTITGEPYRPLRDTLELARESETRTPKKGEYLCTMLHLDAYPDSAKVPPFFGTVRWSELASLYPSNFLALGHIHHSYPIETIGSTVISKPWNIIRVAKDYYVKTKELQQLHQPAYTETKFELVGKPTEDKDLTSILVMIDTINFSVSNQYKIIPDVDPYDVAFIEEEYKRLEDTTMEISGMVDLVSSLGENNKLDPLHVLESQESSQQTEYDKRVIAEALELLRIHQ